MCFFCCCINFVLTKTKQPPLYLSFVAELGMMNPTRLVHCVVCSRTLLLRHGHGQMSFAYRDKNQLLMLLLLRLLLLFLLLLLLALLCCISATISVAADLLLMLLLLLLLFSRQVDNVLEAAVSMLLWLLVIEIPSMVPKLLVQIATKSLISLCYRFPRSYRLVQHLSKSEIIRLVLPF